MRVFFLWIKGAIEGIRQALELDNKVPVESTESGISSGKRGVCFQTQKKRKKFCFSNKINKNEMCYCFYIKLKSDRTGDNHDDYRHSEGN